MPRAGGSPPCRSDASRRPEIRRRFCSWKPLDYFDTNVSGTACLLRAIKTFDVKHLFSSSATVYGDPIELPLR